jgi:cell division protease FtsH
MDDKEKKPGNPWTKSLLIWVGVLFALVLFVQMIDGGSRTATGQAIAYSEFVRQVDEGSVRSVTIATGTSGNSAISGKLDSGEIFHTVAPGDANVSDRLISKGVAVQVKAEEQSSIWMYMLYNSLPFLLILGISFFVMRQMQKNAGSGAMGFGKSRARMLTEKQGRVTFQDVAGIDEAARSCRRSSSI